MMLPADQIKDPSLLWAAVLVNLPPGKKNNLELSSLYFFFFYVSRPLTQFSSVAKGIVNLYNYTPWFCTAWGMAIFKMMAMLGSYC